MNANNKFIPPYISFEALLSGVAVVADKITEHGETYVFKKEDLVTENIAKTIAPRVIRALKDFEILDTKGRVAANVLSDKLYDKEKMRAFIRDKILQNYPFLNIKSECVNHIPYKDIYNYLTQGLSGTTIKRAIEFLKSACSYCGMPIEIIFDADDLQENDNCIECENADNQNPDENLDYQKKRTKLFSYFEKEMPISDNENIKIIIKIDLLGIDNLRSVFELSPDVREKLFHMTDNLKGQLKKIKVTEEE